MQEKRENQCTKTVAYVYRAYGLPT